MKKIPVSHGTGLLFRSGGNLWTFFRCQPQKPFLQHDPERRVHVAEFNPHAKSISGVHHDGVGLKKFCLRANFNEDYRAFGERVRHGEVRPKDAKVFNTGGPCIG